MLRVSKILVLIILTAVLLGSAQNVSAINIDNCSLLDTAGEIYNLTQDIDDSSNTTCVNVTADNVTLDCNGYKIDGVYSSSTYGVYAFGRDNVTVKNCNVTDWWYGVYLNLTSDSVISNDNFTGNNDGIEMINSWYNSISDSYMDNVNENIYLSNSSHNLIMGNSIKGSDIGTSFYSNSHTNTVLRNVFESFNNYAVYLYQSPGNLFRDSNITSTSNHVYHFTSADTTFLNVSLDGSKLVTDAGAVHVKWYLDVRVLDEDDSPLNQANVTGEDKDNVTVFSELTGASGYIERQNITEFHKNFTGLFSHNNYTINATFLSVSNQTSVNVTGNEVVTVYLTGIPLPSVQIKTYTFGLVEKYVFNPGDVVRVRAWVTYTDGREYLSNSTVLIKNNLGSTVVNKELMTNVSEIANGYLYEYNYTLPGNAEGLWPINVTATDSFDGKGYDSLKIAIIQITLQIKLVLNSTPDRIYIPGTGERTFSGLTTTEYPTPDHYYIASYSNDVLKSLVFSYMNPISIFTEKYSSTYGIGTNQRFSNSIVFLVFSRGNWRNVDNRISSIEKYEFLSNPKPSFSFGLGELHSYKIVLNYPNVDINRSLHLGRGINRLTIEKKGFSGGKNLLEVRRV